MQFYTEITEKDLGVQSDSCGCKYRIRHAARAVLLNEAGEVAILHVCRGDYHKLPGGGQEPNEDLLTTLEREMAEEVGAQIKVTNELGVIIEYRNAYEMMQLSYCYLGHTVGPIGQPNYTYRELNDGFSLHWVPIKRAVELLQADEPTNYLGRFIQKRDLIFLKKASQLLREKSVLQRP